MKNLNQLKNITPNNTVIEMGHKKIRHSIKICEMFQDHFQKRPEIFFTVNTGNIVLG